MFEIEYEFRDEDLIKFNELRFMKTEEYRSQMKKNRWIVPSIMMLIGSFYYYYYGDLQAGGYIFVVAILWAWLSPKILMLNVGRQINKNYTDKERKNMFGTYVLTIDPANPQYLQENSPSGKNKIAWNELVRVDREKGYTMLFFDLTTALAIPEETIKRGDIKAFAKQVEKMIELHG
jgi:hypothetical protein